MTSKLMLTRSLGVPLSRLVKEGLQALREYKNACDNYERIY